MKQKINSIIVILFVLLSVGCGTNKAKHEVMKASKSWISNFNSGNTTAIANAYTKDAVMVAKPFGTFEGKKAIGEFWTPFVKSGASDLKYSNTKVDMISDTKAIISSDWEMNVDGWSTSSRCSSQGYWPVHSSSSPTPASALACPVCRPAGSSPESACSPSFLERKRSPAS